MPRTPNDFGGPMYEEAWEPEISTTEPSANGEIRCVTDKGWRQYWDGVPRALGEDRTAHHQPPVDELDVDSPPGSPSTGDRVIVGGTPTGAFVGHAGEIAQWNGTAWVFITTLEGMLAFVKDEDEPYKQVSSSSPWVWDRVYAKKHTEKNDAEATTISSSWTVHVRLPASGTIDLSLGTYEIFATILAYGTNPATQIGLRLREDETTTICEITVLPATTGDAKQPCIARDWLTSLSGEHYYTIEFSKVTGAGVAKVSNSRLSLQRLDNG